MTHVSRIVLAALTAMLAVSGTAYAITPAATAVVPIPQPVLVDPSTTPKQSVVLDGAHLLQHLGNNITNVSLYGHAVDVSSNGISLWASSYLSIGTNPTGLGATTLDKGTYKLSIYLATSQPVTITMTQPGPNLSTLGAPVTSCTVQPGTNVPGTGFVSPPCTFTLPLTAAQQISMSFSFSQTCSLTKAVLNQY